ncbi:MAG TPA: LLM class flavin-dependent oxidoreductase [Aestuariivirgaceae bacterium]|jgi:alkanesulfonate monooxygenase SsuD/methylene tetrahydromethanopterin reductase-like flavin-dependent oxidoreductase (luciferase family)
MKLSLFNLMTQRDEALTPRRIMDEAVSMVRLADEIGFDAAWFAEHHFSNYSICPSPAMMAAYCAGVTNRIRLGAAVYVLPLYNPVRLVQELALLDVQSDGRSVIGIGSGYQKYEFDRYQRQLQQRTEVFMEAWDIIERGLREGRIGYRGKHFNVPDSPMSLRPLQQPMPQIFVTGSDPLVVQRTARSGHIPFMTAGWRGMPLLKEMHRHVQEQYEASGVSSKNMPLAVQQYVYVTSDKKEALELAERARLIARIVTATRAGDPVLVGHFIQAPPLPEEPPLETFLENLVIGDPHYVAEKLVSEIKILGTTHLSCFMQIGSVDGKRAMRSLQRFGKEVIPLMEKSFGMPLDLVHAERIPSTPLRLADQKRPEARYAERV